MTLEELLDTAHRQRQAGNYPEAIETYQQALLRAPRAGNPDLEWQARTFLALTHKLAGDPQKSLRLHEQNLAFARQHPDELLGEPMNRAQASLQSLAADYTSLGDFPRALELLQQALDHENRIGTDASSLGRAKLTQKVGVVQFLSGDRVQAEKSLFAALAEFDSARKARQVWMPAVGEHEWAVAVLRWLQKLLVAQNRTDEALELAEKGRSRAFAGVMASRLGAQRETEPEAALTLDQMKEIAAEQRSTLVEYSVLYQYDPDLPLEFSDYTKTPATDLLMWVIEPSGKISFRQTKLDPPLMLVELVRSARESLGARGRGGSAVDRRETEVSKLPELRRLHHLLIQPIADLLPGDPDARVTFLLQDLLFLVPFAALQDDSGRFLIERHTIATAPSIQVLRLARQQQEQLPEASSGALVVGNPTMPLLGGQALPDLPGAEEEAKAIAELLKAPVLVGAQATKRATIAQMQARIIHLATHGLLDDVDGSFSALALAPADGDSGLLTAREILALRLNAELVVLSACDTGQGRITGDGVLGLSRAFIVAGASSVLVSLWSVPDAPTASLMSTFYTGLESGQDKAQALRQAMLATLKQYPSPLDWAAFTLIGEAEVSSTLATALARGMGGVVGDASPVNAAARRYQVFPVPDGIQQYHEWPSYAGQGEAHVTFVSTIPAGELASFYRRVFVQDGLREVESLSNENEGGFQLVFEGSSNGKKLVVQATDLSDIGADQRTVSVRFE